MPVTETPNGRMQLHSLQLGEGKPLIILHGLFGSGDNWLTIARELAANYRIYLPDQRNHGRSPWSETFTYDAMSDDLLELMEANKIEQPVIIGHSMGGKTAMQFAVRFPTLVSKLVVVDIGPRYYPPHHQSILAGLLSIDPSTLQSRQQADSLLAQHVPELSVRQFLLKSLYRTEDPAPAPSFAWRLNLPVIAQAIEHVGEAISSEIAVELPTLFLRGGQSDYVKEEDMTLIRRIFPRAQLDTIAEAGHWLQAEQPQQFLEKVKQFMEA
jgi:pimeloyl-ACP methyl ester carboxylesterase